MRFARRGAARVASALVASVVLASVVHGSACADDTPEQWLARMSRAVSGVEYQGVFVYIHDGRVESMQIARVLGPNGPREHLVALTGERREVVREGGELRRVMPGGVSTTMASVRSPLLAFDPQVLGSAPQYRLTFDGDDRVAGYATVVLVAQPSDKARYGYRLWLERETGMLVASTLVDGDGAPVEQLMFTSLSLQPSTAPEGAAAAATAAAPVPPGDGARPTFRAPGMPSGFHLIASPAERDAGHQFVYSDGLASVSVYIEPILAGTNAMVGAARRGAINAYGRAAGGVQVIVIGDLPAATVERIALAVEPGASGQ